MKPEIEVKISDHTGNKVKWGYDDDGRYRLDKPYRPKWRAAKFRLPSGKPKCERFFEYWEDEKIIQELGKKYSNFKFILKIHGEESSIGSVPDEAGKKVV